MQKKLLFLIAAIVMTGMIQATAGYTADLTLHNNTGSKALIKLPNADDFQKFALHAQVPLWQLDAASDDAIVIKFRGKAAHALANKSFRIKPANAAKWGDLPKGRIELRLSDSLFAILEYVDSEGNSATTELEILRK